MRLTIEEAARTGKPISYEEYLCTPLTRHRYDIIDGVVSMSPTPTSDHQWIMGEIYAPLKEYVRRNRLGVVLCAPLDVLITREPTVKTRQPDVLFLSAQRTGITGRRHLRTKPILDVTPDIVVEVISPEETTRTLPGKLTDYASIGVPEVWAARAPERTVEVLQLENGQYVRSGLYGVGDVIVSNVLPGLDLNVDAIFAEEDEEDEEDTANP
jgi:Uma2 family endonuclease